MSDDFGDGVARAFRTPIVPRIDHDAIFRASQKTAGRLDAELVFRHLIRELAVFQAELSGEQELGIVLANYGVQSEIHVRSVSYQNPCLIEFAGLLSGTQKVKLIQHISQLNFTLIAVERVDEKPYRVGFGVEL